MSNVIQFPLKKDPITQDLRKDLGELLGPGAETVIERIQRGLGGYGSLLDWELDQEIQLNNESVTEVITALCKQMLVGLIKAETEFYNYRLFSVGGSENIGNTEEFRAEEYLASLN